MVKLGRANAPALLVTARGATPGGVVQMQPKRTMPSAVARIPLYDRYGCVRTYMTVDAADADWVNQWQWKISSPPSSYAYRVDRADGKTVNILFHRALLGLEPGDERQVDHIDRDRLNNRRGNLRVVPKGANAQNLASRSGSSSQYRGVHWDKQARRWRATVHTGGKVHVIGLFVDEHEAGAAARSARMRLMPYAVD